MATKTQALNWARSQIGTVGGSKYWNKVYGWSGSGLAWCAVWCSCLCKETGLRSAYWPSTVAFDRRDRSRIGSAWVEPYDLQAGDFLAFDWDGDKGGDHVGIVEKVIAHGVYQTIEGNVGNSCGRRTRYAADVVGGIRPDYDDSKAAATAPGKLLVDGVFGPVTCKALQEALQARGFYKGYAVDGVFGCYTKLELQKYLRKQGYYSGYALDGDFAYYSVRALQQHLRKLGHFKSSLRLDGKWGYWTTCGLQQALNAGKF